MRLWVKGASALAVVGAVIGLSAGVASAHVTIAEPEHVAGQYTLLTFGVPHGCDGSPTTQVRIKIPESIPQVTPTVNPNWDVDKVMEKLAEPIDGGHGTTLTERVAEVVYTAHSPLPADLRDVFQLSLQAPDLPGETLYFPTVQICVAGESAWVELPTDAVPESELDLPAPKIRLVAAPDGAPVTTAAAGSASPAPSSGSSGGSNAVAVVALIIAIAGLLVGGSSFVLRRRAA